MKQRRDNVQYDTLLSHSSGTDAHHYDTVSNRYSPTHFTKDILSNISRVRTRSTTKKIRHCLENHKGYYLRNSDEHSAVYFGMINQFQEFVHLHVNNSQYITYIIEKPKTDCSVGVRIISTGNSTDLSSLYILT